MKSAEIEVDIEGKHYPVPDWMITYAQDVRRLVGVGDDWHIWLDLVDVPDGSPECDGSTDLEVRYLKARIAIRKDIETDERFRAVIMHEILHCALGQIDLAIDRVRDLVPERLRVHTFMLVGDAFEQTIERLTRALQANVTLSTKETAE